MKVCQIGLMHIRRGMNIDKFKKTNVVSDLAKFCILDKNLKVFGYIFMVRLVFGNILNLLWQL